MRRFQVPAGADCLVNGYIVSISGEMLLHRLQPEGVY